MVLDAFGMNSSDDDMVSKWHNTAPKTITNMANEIEVVVSVSVEVCAVQANLYPKRAFLK